MGTRSLGRERGPAIAAEAFAQRILRAAFGTRVRERCAAIATKFLISRVVAPAFRTAHRLTRSQAIRISFTTPTPSRLPSRANEVRRTGRTELARSRNATVPDRHPPLDLDYRPFLK